MAIEGLELHHGQIEEVTAMLKDLSHQMEDTMEQTATFLTQGLGHELKGDLAVGASDFAQLLHSADEEMKTDIARAAAALEVMHGLLRDADANGGNLMRNY
ncbi:hypothetical protein [Kitasatospora sp. NPDC094015]|uniref:hypothetical protein n=1 Tax=Kitasatospora sp. NPDC094015 TaxID=3155205 RepID=UPI003318F209